MFYAAAGDRTGVNAALPRSTPYEVSERPLELTARNAREGI